MTKTATIYFNRSTEEILTEKEYEEKMQNEIEELENDTDERDFWVQQIFDIEAIFAIGKEAILDEWEQHCYDDVCYNFEQDYSKIVIPDIDKFC